MLCPKAKRTHLHRDSNKQLPRPHVRRLLRGVPAWDVIGSVSLVIRVRTLIPSAESIGFLISASFSSSQLSTCAVKQIGSRHPDVPPSLLVSRSKLLCETVRSIAMESRDLRNANLMA